MVADARMKVTMPEHADDAIIDDALRNWGTATS
jgi:hypothetical protein